MYKTKLMKTDSKDTTRYNEPNFDTDMKPTFFFYFS